MDSTLGMRVDLLREFGRRGKNSSVLSGLPVVGSDVTVGGEEDHQQEKVLGNARLAFKSPKLMLDTVICSRSKTRFRSSRRLAKSKPDAVDQKRCGRLAAIWSELVKNRLPPSDKNRHER
jgi:hypothetical protein